MQSLNDLIASSVPYLLPALGIALILYSTFKKSAEEKLKGKGVYAEGIVFEQSYKPHSTGDEFSNAPDKITVRFVTQKQEWITVITKNSFGAYYSGQYKNGEPVKILYNPDAPDECVIITKQSEKTVRIILICLGFVLCIIGLVQLLK